MTEAHNSCTVEEVEVVHARLESRSREVSKDYVAVEKPLHIMVNGEHYATILCTPSDEEALVIGNIVSEGLVRDLSEIREIKPRKDDLYFVTMRDEVDFTKRLSLTSSFKRLILSSCGTSSIWPFSKMIDRINIPKVKDVTKFDPEVISENVKSLNSLAKIYRKTGGVHAAAIYTSQGELLALAEDVGRHNAVDKVVGLALQRGKSFSGTMVASTGRLTGDVVLKAARLGIPVVASLAAALNSGVEVADRTGVTLVGFVRGSRMIVYTWPERIS